MSAADSPRARPVIGLAGGIGAGKSAVAAILAELGCLVVDSDALAREALADPVVVETLRAWWGDGILDDHGAVDRGAVAAIVFTDRGQRDRLEGLVHPWIEGRRHRRFAEAPPDAPALVIDAPLLFEAGLDAECDATIFVDAPRDVRLERVRSGRGWDDAELARREAAQWPLDRKRAASDHVARNDGDRSSLRGSIERILSEILDTAAGADPDPGSGETDPPPTR